MECDCPRFEFLATRLDVRPATCEVFLWRDKDDVSLEIVGDASCFLEDVALRFGGKSKRGAAGVLRGAALSGNILLLELTKRGSELFDGHPCVYVTIDLAREKGELAALRWVLEKLFDSEPSQLRILPPGATFELTAGPDALSEGPSPAEEREEHSRRENALAAAEAKTAACVHKAADAFARLEDMFQKVEEATSRTEAEAEEQAHSAERWPEVTGSGRRTERRRARVQAAARVELRRAVTTLRCEDLHERVEKLTRGIEDAIEKAAEPERGAVVGVDPIPGSNEDS